MTVQCMGKPTEVRHADKLGTSFSILWAPSSYTSRAILCGFHAGWGILTSWSLQGILEPVPKTLSFSWYYHKALSVAAAMLRIKAEDIGDFGQQMCPRTGKSTPSKKAL